VDAFVNNILNHNRKATIRELICDLEQRSEKLVGLSK